MSPSEVRRSGVTGARPGREATTGGAGAPRGASRRRREELMVPPAEFSSYYGRPILKTPTWQAPDIPGYLFLGGLAGGSSLLAALSQLTGRHATARRCKCASTAAIGLSLVALLHDLGRPGRFLNMLRVLKPTSPMSVGSWLLAAYVPLSGVATALDLAGTAPLLGTAATAGAAALAPAVAAYTAALIADTSVPGWHEARDELPFVFVASAAASAAGLALAAPSGEGDVPLRRIGVAAGAAELGLTRFMQARIGIVADVYRSGKAGRYRRAAEALLAVGVVLVALPLRRRIMRRLGGIMLVVGSALTRFAIFEAGVASTKDPRYSVVPQRERLENNPLEG